MIIAVLVWGNYMIVWRLGSQDLVIRLADFCFSCVAMLFS